LTPLKFAGQASVFDSVLAKQVGGLATQVSDVSVHAPTVVVPSEQLVVVCEKLFEPVKLAGQASVLLAVCVVHVFGAWNP
jgi:hypothetical protein